MEPAGLTKQRSSKSMKPNRDANILLNVCGSSWIHGNSSPSFKHEAKKKSKVTVEAQRLGENKGQRIFASGCFVATKKASNVFMMGKI